MTINEKISILQAAREEKKIRKRLREYDSVGRPVGRWVPCDLESELWDFSCWNYEIAPEPREIWVILNNAGGVHSASSNRDLISHHGETIRFREVIE